MKTKQLEKAVINYEKRSKIRSLRTSAVYPNHECDVLVITQSGYAIEYEIKISRSDFFADRKKDKHRTMSKGKGGKISRFFYVVPAGMVKLDEVPEYAGLIFVDERLQCSVIKNGSRLQCKKVSQKDVTRIYRSIMYRWLKDQTK